MNIAHQKYFCKTKSERCDYGNLNGQVRQLPSHLSAVIGNWWSDVGSWFQETHVLINRSPDHDYQTPAVYHNSIENLILCFYFYLPVSKSPGEKSENLETREKVLRSAAELISRQGYYHVTVREICEAAGVTKPVLYYYFKDKEDLLAEIVTEGHLRFLELIDRYIKPEAAFKEKLEGLFKVYESYAEIYPYLIRVRAHVQFSPLPEKIKTLSDKKSKELMKSVFSVFEKGKEENFFNENEEPEMLAYSLIAPLTVIIVQTVLLRNNTKPLKDHLKKYFQFWKSQFLNREK